jgi:hypothetical protein
MGLKKIMSIDFRDPVACFTLSGTSPFNESQEPVGKLLANTIASLTRCTCCSAEWSNNNGFEVDSGEWGRSGNGR